MSGPRVIFVAVGIAALAWAAIGVRAGDAPVVDAAAPAPAGLRVFFDRYCVECHGAKRPKGDVRLDASATLPTDAESLHDLFDAIADAQMPPRKAERHPSRDERAAAAAVIRDRLLAVEAAASRPGLVRLTRRQYRFAVKDLLGIDFDRASLLPPDNAGAGFDNTAAGLLLGPDAMTQYMDAAAQVAAMAIEPLRPPVRTRRFTRSAEFFGGGELRDLPGSEGGALLTGQGATFYPKFEVNAAGTYEIVIDGADELTRWKKGMRDPEQVPLGDYELLPMRVRVGIQRPWREPEVPSFPILEPGKPTRMRVEPGQYFQFIYRVTRKKASETGGEYDLASRFRMKRVTVRGPFDPDWPPSSHERIFGDMPADADAPVVDATIDRLVRRLTGRPGDADELAVYHALAQAERDAGGNAYAAVKVALRAMLCSPAFLFAGGGRGDGDTLDAHAIAARLSRLLWNTLPDEPLLADADSGKLLDPAARRAHALRMIADPRARRFTEDFVTRWLALHKLSGIAVHDAYGINLERIADSITREPIEFTRTLLDDNLSILNFIDSDFVVIDNALRGYYGLRVGPIRSGFQRVDLPADQRSRRGGLLTQAAFAMLTSDGTHTSPILRGVWVLENLYGVELTQPESVPPLKSPAAGESVTLVDLVARHRADPSCARCHDRIDPLGVALENIDLNARWRDTYREPTLVTETYTKNGKELRRDRWELHDLAPVASSATLADGRTLDGLAGLRAMLAADRDRFARAFVERLFTYAIARRPLTADRPAIDAVLESTRPTDHRLGDLIVELIASDAFIRR